MQKLSVKECVSFGWRTFKSRAWFFIGSSAVLFLLGMLVNIPQWVTKSPDDHMTLIGVVGFLVSALLSIFISMGRTAFYLRAHDSVGSVELSDFWHPRPYIKFLGASVLVGAATVVGLILLIVPGIFIGIIFSFVLYIVIEKELSPIKAMKESARMTKGNRWALLRLGIAVLGINIIGVLLVLVGLLATLPISALAIIHAYRTLSVASISNEIA